MARATISLPVPVSPSSSTDVSVGATRAISASISVNAGARPTRPVSELEAWVVGSGSMCSTNSDRLAPAARDGCQFHLDVLVAARRVVDVQHTLARAPTARAARSGHDSPDSSQGRS